MSIFRPSNINKRLVGFGATIAPKDSSQELRSPGNAGQIGPKKTPYIHGVSTAFTLGYSGTGGSCGGVFRVNESNCGVQRFCKEVEGNLLGGFLICKASPVRWIVAPPSSEVSRCWDARGDANTRAQQVSGCTGWFVPSSGQLQNPGYCCRDFWGPSPCYSFATYWSDSPRSYVARAFPLNFVDGTVNGYGDDKSVINCVRSFRCVTY